MGSVIPDKFAVMALDPGGTTGYSTGVFRTDRTEPMLKPVIKRAIKKGAIKSGELRGEPAKQSRLAYHYWLEFRSKLNIEYGVGLDHIHLVCEDFMLWTKHANLAPVLMMGGLLTLLRYGPVMDRHGQYTGPMSWPYGEPSFQPPSQKKTVSNQRLKELGLWVPGSTHRRDSNRHLVAKVDSIL